MTAPVNPIVARYVGWTLSLIFIVLAVLLVVAQRLRESPETEEDKEEHHPDKQTPDGEAKVEVGKT